MTSLDVEFVAQEIERREYEYNQERGVEVDYYLADLRDTQ